MTNGIIAIKRGGKVIIKIVVGCEGYNAPKVAEAIRQHFYKGGNLKCENVEQIVIDNDMGCEDCLVIIWGGKSIGINLWQNGARVKPDDDNWNKVDYERYVDTFQLPKFNPRWKQGTCGFVEIVEFWEQCYVCDKPVEEYEPKYCCSGHECGCRGLPIDPAICSDECWDAVMHKSGTTIDERMKQAGVKKWEYKTDSADL